MVTEGHILADSLLVHKQLHPQHACRPLTYPKLITEVCTKTARCITVYLNINPTHRYRGRAATVHPHSALAGYRDHPPRIQLVHGTGAHAVGSADGRLAGRRPTRVEEEQRDGGEGVPALHHVGDGAAALAAGGGSDRGRLDAHLLTHLQLLAALQRGWAGRQGRDTGSGGRRAGVAATI